MKARAEFLAVRGGRRASTPAFLIEMRERPPAATPTPKRTSGPRFGFTITKKLGNAVTRNRIRRRLKAAFAASHNECRNEHTAAACDYVIVARHAALDRPFTLLLEDVARSLSTLHRSPGPSRTGDRRSPSLPSPPSAGGKKGSA